MRKLGTAARCLQPHRLWEQWCSAFWFRPTVCFERDPGAVAADSRLGSACEGPGGTASAVTRQCNTTHFTCLFDGPDLRVATSQPVEGDDEWFDLSFGGQRIWVHVPSNAVCEVSGRRLEQSDLRAAMRLELEEIDAFREHCAVNCD